MNSKAIFVIVLGLSGLLNIIQYRTVESLKVDKTELSLTIDAQEKYIATLHSNDELLAQLDKQQKEFADVLAKYQEANEHALQSLLQNDKSVSDWSGDTIPDSLMQLYRNRNEARLHPADSTGRQSASDRNAYAERKH